MGKPSRVADTPLMRQYLDVKARYPDAIVFFRLGDFYEMFHEDAVYVARALDLTLTTRDKGKEDPVPMCGVPHHAVRTYLQRLTDLGHRVALCEQLEDPKVAKGIVKRDVVRVVTPGVLLDEESLDPRAPNFVAAVAGDARQGWGLAFLDVTTGEFRATEASTSEGLLDELARADPRELVVPRGDPDLASAVRRAYPRLAQAAVPDDAGPPPAKALLDALGPGFDAAAAERHPVAVAAAARVLAYARATQPAAKLPLGRLEVFRRSDYLVLDEQARSHLELTESLIERKRRGSLLEVIDETRSAMGGRLLRRWLLFPLVDVARIRRRHDAVERLVADQQARDAARDVLRQVGDIERLAGRARLGVATPRDVAALGASLARLPALAKALRAARAGEIGAGPGTGADAARIPDGALGTGADAMRVPDGGLLGAGAMRVPDGALLGAGTARIPDRALATGADAMRVPDGGLLGADAMRVPDGGLGAGRVREGRRQTPRAGDGEDDLLDLGRDLAQDLADEISRTIRPDAPATTKDGGFVNAGISPELDELRGIAAGGRDRILEIETRERQRTGISSLKVKYNSVFGYYIEITRAQLANAPADYVRKQTVANAERFVTPELADYESKILSADERRVTLEMEIFTALRDRIAADAHRLLALAGRVAAADALAGLAELAHRHGYCRPEVDESSVIDLRDARHPVVERLAAAGGFVPNDVRLDPDAEQILIVTGPNMAGKSTLIRQVALAVILAQMGGFVPAATARIGLVDRVFTRVGAGDNLARGESTFLVEMRETAHILRHATPRSLIVLDEIGRGTSTYDGVSIAWAVAEHIHDRVRARTLFATHYHELCALADLHPRVRNVSVAAREWKGDVIFLRKLTPGGASRSFGIEVGKLAGLPESVVARAKGILASLEQGGTSAGMPHPVSPPAGAAPQLGLFAAPAAPGPADEVAAALRAMDPDDLSPRAALDFVVTLRKKLTDAG